MAHITVTASEHSPHKDITLLSVKGFIDTNTAPEFDRTFQSVLSENKFKLIVDLKDVNYISSAGWGLFVGEIKRIRSQKGDLFLASMTPEVNEAYELLQFHTILKSFPTVDQAVQKGFGKIQAAKGAPEARSASASAAKASKKAQGAKVLERAPEPAPVAVAVRKLPWHQNILKPWEWFR